MILSGIIDLLHKLSSEAARNESFLTSYLYLVRITRQLSWLVYQCWVVIVRPRMGQDVEGMGLGERAICLSLFVCLAVAVFTTVRIIQQCPVLTDILCYTTGGPDLPHQHCLHSNQEGAQCRVRDDPRDVHQHLEWHRGLYEKCLLFRVVHGRPRWGQSCVVALTCLSLASGRLCAQIYAEVRQNGTNAIFTDCQNVGFILTFNSST